MRFLSPGLGSVSSVSGSSSSSGSSEFQYFSDLVRPGPPMREDPTSPMSTEPSSSWARATLGSRRASSRVRMRWTLSPPEPLDQQALVRIRVLRQLSRLVEAAAHDLRRLTDPEIARIEGRPPDQRDREIATAADHFRVERDRID